MWIAWQTLSWILMAFLCVFFINRLKGDYVAMMGFAMKMGMGLGMGLIYRYFYQGGDTWTYYREASTMAWYAVHHASRFYEIYFHTLQEADLAKSLVFADQPRALFFAKIVSIVYWPAGGSYWLTALYFSMISFWATHGLVRAITNKYPQFSMEAKVAFYFVPTFVFWSGGLLKESLAVASLCIMTSMILQMSGTKSYRNAINWLWMILAGWMLWKLKYYYAAVSMPLLLYLFLTDAFQRKIKRIGFYASGLLLAGIVIMSMSHYNLHPGRVLDVVYQNYNLVREASTSQTIHFYKFDGSITGFLLNVPYALAGGLFFPLIPKFDNLLLSMVSMENMAIFILFVYVIWPVGIRLPRPDKYAMVALMFIVVLAIMMAFAMPNLGTLSRYKAIYWPYFVLLLLIGARYKKRS